MKGSGGLTLWLLVAVLGTGAGTAQAARERESWLTLDWFSWTTPGLGEVDSGLYRQACGHCHFAYQPGLLPAHSWERIMGGLNEHFGKRVELEGGDLNRIRNFLLNSAAGRANYGISNRFMQAQKGYAFPLRITEMRYFVEKHPQPPEKMAGGKAGVTSFTECDACHQDAQKGIYREGPAGRAGPGGE
ncbi:MAG TPA: cytochrome C [Sedimenticola sp.]|nr:cytochrome C [Sedimenticola sp.]